MSTYAWYFHGADGFDVVVCARTEARALAVIDAGGVVLLSRISFKSIYA
jgi:hypothetical protein